jgi:hypothetical protein
MKQLCNVMFWLSLLIAEIAACQEAIIICAIAVGYMAMSLIAYTGWKNYEQLANPQEPTNEQS